MKKFLMLSFIFLLPVLIFSISFDNNYFIENPALAVRNGFGLQTYYSSPTDYGFCLGVLNSRLFYLNKNFSYSTALGFNGFYIGYDSKGIYGAAYKNNNFYVGLDALTKDITKIPSSVLSFQTGFNYDPMYMDLKLTKSSTITYKIGGGINLGRFNIDLTYSPKDFMSVGLFYQDRFFGFGGDYILKYGALKNTPYYRVYLNLGNWFPRAIKEDYFLFYSIDSIDKPLDPIVFAINRASDDPKCKGILVRISNLKESLLNLGRIEELRSALENFKGKGKKVIFYINGDSTFATYYLASCATRIYMPPLSNLYSLGYTLNIYKYGDLLKNIGINIQEITAGKYKSTMHSTMPQLSEDQKDAMIKLVQSIENKSIYDISKDRAIDPVTLENFMNGQMLDANVAKSNKLIDNVGYFSDALDEFSNLVMKNLLPYYPNQSKLFEKNVYILPIFGTIVQGPDSTFNSYVTDEWVVNRLTKIEKDPNAAAVILRIDSPGGSAAACEHIWRKLDELRRRGIYTVASMSGVAASGGYYIASGCDTIVANPMTITGNIGVVYQIVDYSSLLNKLKIREYTIKTGFYDDMYNGTRPLTPDERAKIQKVVDNSYDLFLKRVSQGRRIPFDDLKTIADGKIYTGSMAASKNVRLVDSTGGLGKAIDIVENYLNASDLNLIYINTMPNWLRIITDFINPKEFLNDGLYFY